MIFFGVEMLRIWEKKKTYSKQYKHFPSVKRKYMSTFGHQKFGCERLRLFLCEFPEKYKRIVQFFISKSHFTECSHNMYTNASGFLNSEIS